MYLGVRKPVVDANRSGCSYEIPDTTWFSKRNKRAVILKSGVIVYLTILKLGGTTVNRPCCIVAAGTFFIQGVLKMMINTCGGNPRY